MNKWKGTFLVMVCAIGLTTIAGAMYSAEAALLTQLDFTSGDANWNGVQGRILDRLFDQDGTITIGSYQAMTGIVDPSREGRKTYSLFTSGLTGAPAPSAVINGNSITVDLSSLFFGWRRGDDFRAWNIGGHATGLFNPET